MLSMSISALSHLADTNVVIAGVLSKIQAQVLRAAQPGCYSALPQSGPSESNLSADGLQIQI